MDKDDYGEYGVRFTEESKLRKVCWVHAYSPEEAIEKVKEGFFDESQVEEYIDGPTRSDYTAEKTHYMNDKEDAHGR